MRNIDRLEEYFIENNCKYSISEYENDISELKFDFLTDNKINLNVNVIFNKQNHMVLCIKNFFCLPNQNKKKEVLEYINSLNEKKIVLKFILIEKKYITMVTSSYIQNDKAVEQIIQLLNVCADTFDEEYSNFMKLIWG